MNRNSYAVLILFVLSVAIAFSSTGSYYWQDGEIARGTKINSALDEKANTSANELIVLTPQTGFATATAVMGTIYKNADGQMIYLATGTTWYGITATTTFNW